MSAEVTLELDGVKFRVHLIEENGQIHADVDGIIIPLRADVGSHQSLVSAGASVFDVRVLDTSTVAINGRPTPFRIHALSGVAGAQKEAAGVYGPMYPPMTGRIEAILVQEGQAVDAGDVLFVLEAMKMRNEVKAPAAGVIGDIAGTAGSAVEPSDLILELLPPMDD